MARMSRRGFSMIELMLGSAILIGGGGAMLVGMHYTMVRVDYLEQFQIALHAAHSQLEALSATTYGALLLDPAWDLAPGGTGSRFVAVPQLHSGGVVIQIRSADPRTPTTPSLLDLHVAACWESRGRRFGEDQDCDGVVDAGEDANGNGWVDSPAMVSTRLSRGVF